MASYDIRQATIDDAATIAQHRVRMFQDMGQVPSAELANELLAASAQALGGLLQSGTYVGWLAVTPERRVVGGAGEGIARALMHSVLAWANRTGCDRVVLHASEAGQPLYRQLGFTPGNEMRWFPPQG
jgi:GNAT superfamily N-acetyltransferase